MLELTIYVQGQLSRYMPHAYEYYNCLWLTTNYRVLHFPMISGIGSDNLLACMCVCVCVRAYACACACMCVCMCVCACHTLGMKSHVRFSYAPQQTSDLIKFDTLTKLSYR